MKKGIKTKYYSHIHYDKGYDIPFFYIMHSNKEGKEWINTGCLIIRNQLYENDWYEYNTEYDYPSVR